MLLAEATDLRIFFLSILTSETSFLHTSLQAPGHYMLYLHQQPLLSSSGQLSYLMGYSLARQPHQLI